jgi:hypothetical protein
VLTRSEPALGAARLAQGLFSPPHLRQPQPQLVIDRHLELLLPSQVAFGRLDGGVPERRVALGGHPPRAPTDPDVRVDASGSSGHRVRCVMPPPVVRHGTRERVTLQKTVEAVQRQAGFVGAPIEPLPPKPRHLASKAIQRPHVADNPVVVVVSE